MLQYSFERNLELEQYINIVVAHKRMGPEVRPNQKQSTNHNARISQNDKENGNENNYKSIKRLNSYRTI